MITKGKRLQIRVSEELISHLDDLCSKYGVNRSDMIRTLVMREILKEDKPNE